MAEASLSWLHRAGLVVLLLLLGYAMNVAVRSALADAYAAPAERYLQVKRDSDEVLTSAEWQGLEANLRRSLALVPGDPATLSELGRLYRIQLEADDLDVEEIIRIGNQSARYYQAALELRPTWPWDWASLAMVKYQQYQRSSDLFQQALVKAGQFGPQESALQERIVDLGVGDWLVLRPEAARAVLIAAERTLTRDPKAFAWMEDQPEVWRSVCARAGDDLPQLRRRCEEARLT